MYTTYVVFLGELISEVREDETACWPGCWRDSELGRAFIGLLGIAFLIASITQIVPALIGNFRLDLIPAKKLHPAERVLLNVTGRVGCLGRAAAFMMIAVLMFRALHEPLNTDSDPIADALRLLQTSQGGKAFLAMTGVGLIVYGVYCVLSMHYRVFPTVNRANPEESITRAVHDQRDIHAERPPTSVDQDYATPSGETEMMSSV